MNQVNNNLGGKNNFSVEDDYQYNPCAAPCRKCQMIRAVNKAKTDGLAPFGAPKDQGMNRAHIPAANVGGGADARGVPVAQVSG
jgi:hypothetical protein